MAKNKRPGESLEGLFMNIDISEPEKNISESYNQMIDINVLNDFKDHPFKVEDDESMEILSESIKNFGVQEPLLVRKKDNGYEVISGHRRKRAAFLAGLKEVPVKITDIDDDLATIIMVDSNNKREKLYPSEMAFAYKMKVDALKHKGQRSDLTGKEEKQSAEQVGDSSGISKRHVYRYIKLAELIKPFLDMVDQKKLSITNGLLLTALDEKNQTMLYDFLSENKEIKLTNETVNNLLEHYNKRNFISFETLENLLNCKKQKKTINLKLSEEVYEKYFPEKTNTEIESLIIQLLDEWKKANT